MNGSPLEQEEDCVQCSASSSLCSASVDKSGVDDAAHQTGLLFQRGKTSLENSQSGDVFIVCSESPQMTMEMKKAYSFSM